MSSFGALRATSSSTDSFRCPAATKADDTQDHKKWNDKEIWFRDHAQASRVGAIILERLADDRVQEECRYLSRLRSHLFMGYQEVSYDELQLYVSQTKMAILDNLFALITCSLTGREMTLTFDSGSRVAEIYGSTSAREEYYCNFGVDPGKVGLLASSGLRISGSDSEGEVRVIELPNHPFYVGTLFVPQTGSTERHPHPLVTAFAQAVAVL